MVTTESALLTNSRLKVARACQRKHRIMYQLGFRPVEEAETLRFGSLIHAALEVWWRAWQFGGDPLMSALSVIETRALDAFDRAKADALMTGYHLRWKDEPYEVIAVEVSFETDVINPETGKSSRTWRLAGKLDAVVRDLRDRRTLLVEHKTSSEDISPGSDYWKQLRMDGQVSIYFDGARALGHHVYGCLYDVIGKPGLRPLKATPLESRKYTKQGQLYANQRDTDETPEQFHARLVEAIAADPSGYYQRGEVVRLDAEMEEARFDIWALGKQIREAELAGRAPRNPDSCKLYGRPCAFFDVCTGAATLEDSSRFTRSDVLHPELADHQPKEEAVQ